MENRRPYRAGEKETHGGYEQREKVTARCESEGAGGVGGERLYISSPTSVRSRGRFQGVDVAPVEYIASQEAIFNSIC